MAQPSHAKAHSLKCKLLFGIGAIAVVSGAVVGIVVGTSGGSDSDAPVASPPPSSAGGSGTLKLLCLHGGGQSAAGFEGDLQALASSLGSHVTFVFGSSPYAANLWIRDPPGGKGEPTTDPDWALDSFTYLDDLISSQGPFDGLVGFSQGGAMTVAYLAQADALGSFRFAVVFCGYIPSTHTGLVNRIDAAAPMSTPTLFYIGRADAIIVPSMSEDAATKFANATLVYGPGGHAPPQSGTELAQVTDFIEAFL